MSKTFYKNMYAVFAGLIRRLFRIRIIGGENEPATGPFLICANHLSYFDVVIIAASLRNQVRYLAKAELFRIPLLNTLIRALGAFPVKRGESDVGAIRNTIKILQDGEVVGIYPQGTRRPGVHPAETPLKNGMGMVVCRAQTTILPVAIITDKFRVGMFKKTTVRIGTPIPYEELAVTGTSQEEYRRITQLAFDRVIDLVNTP